MSGFGQDLLPTDNGKDDKEDDKDSSIFDKIGDVAGDAFDKLSDELNDIGNSAADKLAEALGISEWYSLHLMDSCEGGFTPNATSPSPGLNVTNCTDSSVGYKINLTQLVDHELDVGPFDLNLADLNFPDGIQRQINKVNRLLMAVTIFYLIGLGLSGLCVVLAVGDLFMGDRKRLFALIGLAVAGLATLALMIGAAITTAAATNGADTITDIGENVGVYASAGTKFMALSWVSFAVMFLAFTFWLVSMCSHRRAKKRAMYGEKPRGKWSF